MPEIAFGIDLLPGGDSKAYWYMHVMSMPASNCRCRFSSHGCMNSILCQTYTIDAVLGISGHPSNHVTWIDILEFQVKRMLFGILLDVSFEQETDIFEQNITG